MNKTFIFLFACSLLMFTSCATLISGTTQKINFQSNPSNASVFVDGFEIGKTPFQTSLERRSDHKVMIQLEGYKSYQVNLVRNFNAWYIGNFVFGGIIGLVIDPITGAIYQLSPSQVNAQLEKGMVAKTFSSDLFIAVSLEKEENWKKIGQLEKR